MENVAKWACLFILILLSALFSGAETAMTTVSRIRLRSMAEEGNERARHLLKLQEKWAKMLSSILVGNNVVNLAASALATILAMDLGVNVGITTMLLTVIILIFGEITPKNIAAAYSEYISLALSGFIGVLMTVMTPVVWIIDKLSGLLLTLMRVDLSKASKSMTESDLRTIVDVGHEDGVIESSERKMINNVFDFGDSRAKDIMIPRIDVTEIDINSDYEHIFEIFRSEHYTRLPVYAEDTDNIVGILNIKDFFFSDREEFKVRSLMRDVHYTYELKRTSELMVDMRNDSSTLAVVLNEYGAAVGIITMEDLIEEIVGEIRDEYDADEIDLIQQTSEGEYDVDSSVKLDDLNDTIGSSFESEDYDSLGGFILEKLDHLPKPGERVVTDDGSILEVVSAQKNRIERVHVTLARNTGEPENQDGSET